MSDDTERRLRLLESASADALGLMRAMQQNFNRAEERVGTRHDQQKATDRRQDDRLTALEQDTTTTVRTTLEGRASRAEVEATDRRKEAEAHRLTAERHRDALVAIAKVAGLLALFLFVIAAALAAILYLLGDAPLKGPAPHDDVPPRAPGARKLDLELPRVAVRRWALAARLQPLGSQDGTGVGDADAVPSPALVGVDGAQGHGRGLA